MSAQSNPSNPLDASRLRVVLDAETTRRGALLQALLDQGVAVTATGDGAVAPLDGDDLLLLADDIADGDETELDGADGIRLGIDGLDAAGVVDRVKARGQGEASGGWTPWFPVIDYDRCTNCMQCLSFCLFGVYDVDDNKTIDVAQPQRCKTHCPACSRVCPEVAILFPKYRHGPINGDVVVDADVEREKMKVDVSALLGGDIYALLRQRSERAQSRFSRERDEERALKERQRCLKKLQDALDIPQEVLDELPTAEAIRSKAAAHGAEASASDSVDQNTADPTPAVPTANDSDTEENPS